MNSTYRAMQMTGAGDLVVVHGIGGPGHEALQYARKMGFRVAAVGRGQDIAEDALGLGTHLYIDAAAEDPVRKLKSLGGAKAIITTSGDAKAVSSLMSAFAPQGRLVL